MSTEFKFVTNPSLLTNENVIEMRTAAKLENPPPDSFFAAKFGVSIDSVGKAIRGGSFKHLDAKYPPVKRVRKRIDAVQKARDLYISGKTYVEIMRELKVAKSSVSQWCSDLAAIRNEERIKQRALERERKKEARQKEKELQIDKNKTIKIKTLKERKIRLSNGLQILTNEDVIFIRRQVRIDGIKNLKKWSEKYNVGIASISFAISGRTFTQVNHIEPPIPSRVKLPSRSLTGERKYVVSEELVQEGLSLRRSDPLLWTYSKLAILFKERTGRNYQSAHIAKLLRNRDASIVELEAIKPPKPPKIPKPPKERKPRKSRAKPLLTKTCVICEEEFTTKNEYAELCGSKECLDIVRVENIRERQLEKLKMKGY